MYNVTQYYKDKIQELDRVFKLEIRIEHDKGTLILEDKHIVQGSFQCIDSSQASEEFTVGGTVASHIEFDLVNKKEYEDINFIGARIVPTVAIQIQEGVDAHFLQPSQPSKMIGYDEKWEYIPLGQFNIDIADRKRSTIVIKAIDNMINLDKPYSLSKLSYPANLYQIFTNICNVADVGIGTTSFTNQNYIVNEKPEGKFTLRNILGFIAELSGSFARFNRFGNLELRWYEDSGITITSEHRSSLEMGDIEIGITGISVEGEDDVIYLTGTEDYAIDLTGNELLQGNLEDVLPNILTKIEGTKFIPYTANWHGNPAMESGDKITHIDVDGNIFETIITNNSYKYRGTGKLDAKGLPNIVRGFESTDNRIASIVKKVEKEVGDKLTDLEQAMLNATEILTGQLGGHVLKREGELLIMDNENVELAQKIWRWNLGGLGYTTGGINGIYETAMTMDGSINAKFITTGIMSANLVKTGIITSSDGGFSLNLDTGTFSFNKGILQFTEDGIKVSHGDNNNYSKMDTDGFHRYDEGTKRMYHHRTHIGDFTFEGHGLLDDPLEIQLPSDFVGKDFSVSISLKGIVMEESKMVKNVRIGKAILSKHTGSFSVYVSATAVKFVPEFATVGTLGGQDTKSVVLAITDFSHITAGYTVTGTYTAIY